MKYKDNIYNEFRKLVKSKDTAVNAFMNKTLAQTQSMFTYKNLPETIPQMELERLLQAAGNCFITKVNGELYALSGGKGGECDVYNRPTIYTVANSALQLSANYVIGKDGVLIENDSEGNSLLPIIGKYAVLYTDSLISLNTASILTRITMLISASDDRTKQSADLFLEKIENGDYSVIAESAFYKGITMQTAPTTNSVYITQLIELVQYVKASMYNELGLNANYNMKRERLNLGEVSMNVDALLPYVENMFNCRKTAIQQVNEMFGTDITVDLNSSWKLEKENFDALMTDTETERPEETADNDNGTDNPDDSDNGTDNPDDSDNGTDNPDDSDNDKNE